MITPAEQQATRSHSLYSILTQWGMVLATLFVLTFCYNWTYWNWHEQDEDEMRLRFTHEEKMGRTEEKAEEIQ